MDVRILGYHEVSLNFKSEPIRFTDQETRRILHRRRRNRKPNEGAQYELCADTSRNGESYSAISPFVTRSSTATTNCYCRASAKLATALFCVRACTCDGTGNTPPYFSLARASDYKSGIERRAIRNSHENILRGRVHAERTTRSMPN